jgi:hypothetical protein
VYINLASCGISKILNLGDIGATGAKAKRSGNRQGNIDYSQVAAPLKYICGGVTLRIEFYATNLISDSQHSLRSTMSGPPEYVLVEGS